MKERPILFSTEMVKAILEGRKTQTRRVKNLKEINLNPASWRYVAKLGGSWKDKAKYIFRFINPTGHSVNIASPYGLPGDRLWVRETWAKTGDNFHDDWPGHGDFYYRADDPFAEMEPNSPTKGIFRWRPSIFMPREACRIMLEIIDVRVERLQVITEEDAIAEGVEPDGKGWKSYEIIHQGRHKGEANPHSVVPNKSPITSYMELWESINGIYSWDKDPWVWVIEFKRIEP